MSPGGELEPIFSQGNGKVLEGRRHTAVAVLRKIRFATTTQIFKLF